MFKQHTRIGCGAPYATQSSQTWSSAAAAAALAYRGSDELRERPHAMMAWHAPLDAAQVHVERLGKGASQLEESCTRFVE